MKLIFSQDKDTGEYFAVDTESLREYLCTKQEYDAKKLQDKDPKGKPRWEWKRWSK